VQKYITSYPKTNLRKKTFELLQKKTSNPSKNDGDLKKMKNP
jgi:hypothetical protein